MFVNIFTFVFFAILDEVQPVPVQVPYVKPDPEKANPKIGVGQVAFSRDNRYLATKNGKYVVENGGKPFFLPNSMETNRLSTHWKIVENRNTM